MVKQCKARLTDQCSTYITPPSLMLGFRSIISIRLTFLWSSKRAQWPYSSVLYNIHCTNFKSSLLHRAKELRTVQHDGHVYPLDLECEKRHSTNFYSLSIIKVTKLEN